MKLIFLIIASNDLVHVQDELTQRKTWAKSNSIESIWLHGGDTTYFDKYERTLCVPMEEAYKNILPKTLHGLNWCVDNIEFDFLIRANVSTYFEVEKIMEILEKYSPNEDLFGGYLDFIKSSAGNSYHNMFVNGGAIFLSNKTVKRLLRMNFMEWFDKPDDYAISQYLFSQKVKPIQIPRGNLSNTGILSKKPYYRAKSSSNPVMASLRMQSIFDLSEESNPLRRMNHYRVFYKNELKFFQKNFGTVRNYSLNIYSYLSATLRARRILGSHDFGK